MNNRKERISEMLQIYTREIERLSPSAIDAWVKDLLAMTDAAFEDEYEVICHK